MVFALGLLTIQDKHPNEGRALILSNGLLLLTSGFFLFINTLVAIKRCPYCQAIIEEPEQYCNNCGTQLLFPEDEKIEEDIPGEKIIDEESGEEEFKEEDKLEIL